MDHWPRPPLKLTSQPPYPGSTGILPVLPLYLGVGGRGLWRGGRFVTR